MGVLRIAALVLLTSSSGFLEAFRPGHWGDHRPHGAPSSIGQKSEKSIGFIRFLALFFDFFDLSAILDHHGLQDASKTPKIPFKTAPRPPKTPPRRPRSPPRGFQDRPRRLQETSRRLQDGQDRLQDASKTAQEASKCLQDDQDLLQDRQDFPLSSPDASKTLNIASKTVQSVRKLFQKLTCLPGSCQLLPGSCQVLARFTSIPEMFSPQWSNTTADCHGHGRLPRVVWRFLPARASSI